MAEEELLDLRLRFATLEKKYSTADNRNKDLEENLKRVRAAAVEDLSAESDRVKDHFIKLVERLEDENRGTKEKVRAYELSLIHI